MKTSVVVVEDNLELLDQLITVLDAAPDIECLYTADSGEEAMARIPTEPPQVVLMDINLPGMSGIECVRYLKKRLPSLEIIMFTIYEDAEKIFEALKAGASGYLIKSSDPTAIYSAIHDARNGGAPFTSLIARKVIRHFQAPPSKPHAYLSPREEQIIELIAQGYTYREIAEHLIIGYETVRTHVKNTCAKMQVQGRLNAVIKHLAPHAGSQA